MVDDSLASLVDGILYSLDTENELESWFQRHLNGSIDNPVLGDTFRLATQRLLSTESVHTAQWERMLVGAAGHDSRADGEYGCDACKAAITELTEMIHGSGFSSAPPEQIVTFASALTLVLAAQRKLRQPIENAVQSLCQMFPDLLPEMAERCQDIWRRNGQMSGADGLFVWDIRNNQWRLRQTSNLTGLRLLNSIFR